MSNSFYNHGAFPSTGSAATSASMRAELDLVSAGFDKMPTLSGNASEPGCYTLLFAPNSPQVAALVSTAIARSPGLSVGVDVAPVPGLVPFPAPPEYLHFVNASLFANGGDGATCASAAGP